MLNNNYKMWIIFILFLSINSVFATQLPDGMNLDSIECRVNKGKFSYSFIKNNEIAAYIKPGTCDYDNVYDDFVDSNFYAEFYGSMKKDTFATSNEAMEWLLAEIENYYKPDDIRKWKKLQVQPPKVFLEYPWEWSYRLDKYEIFDSKCQSENKLVLLDKGGSEIIQIIRTPNTAKHSTQKIMDLSAMMNRAINFKQNPPIEVNIDGKIFKSVEHTFMDVMLQKHFWYADENEIIYIGYGLLKDQKIKYPNIMKHIIDKISW